MNLSIPAVAGATFLWIASCAPSANEREWKEYLGGPDRNHYSTLDEIRRENVSQLRVAWTYHTGDSGQMQCNPLIVDGVLYGMTATVQPFALDAATGTELWRTSDSSATTWYGTARGLVYWRDGEDRRILYTKEEWLCALDAGTGKPVETFGVNGRVSLKAGLGESAREKFVISNTPGTVYEDLIIMPLRLSEEHDAAPGYIQAFNIRSGALTWVFKTIPEPGEHGYDTWPPDAYKNGVVGGANNWAGMAIDRERGIVYVPTGSAAFDFHGGFRKGDNLFANTLLALDARSGRRLWHFQFVHHDVLDRDAPAPPNLVTLKRDGRRVDAVAQVTKQGYVFVFDRETGEPLFPISEQPVPASTIPHEYTSPTQPVPLKPAPFARQTLTESDLNPFSRHHDELLDQFRTSRNEGPFTPLSREGTIVFPGLDGGAEWGGAAVDLDGVMYLNSNEMAWRISLDPERIDDNSLGDGHLLYQSKCASCHGRNLEGNPASGFPTLANAQETWNEEHLTTVIRKGKGMMPGFNALSNAEIQNLTAFLLGHEQRPSNKSKDTSTSIRYQISGYTKFLDRDGYPAISPPWGTLSAIDLNTGEYLWQRAHGEYPELRAQGIPQTGAESYGGPIVTKGGLLFIAGTKDGKFRAYDKENGELLWETQLPAAAFATPATFKASGKQFVVIACGGTKLGAAKGDTYVAFSLPAN